MKKFLKWMGLLTGLFITGAVSYLGFAIYMSNRTFKKGKTHE